MSSSNNHTITTIEQHPDESDRASDIQQFENELALKRHRQQPKEKPVFNDNGLRICVDCDVLIPIERIRANEHAVRCVHCQDELERFNKLHGYRYG